MRKALIGILLLLTSGLIGFISRGCAEAEIDLREPIYLVVENSFLYDCAYQEDIDKIMSCRNSRIQVLNDGADDWFKHFDEVNRPRVIIVYSKDDIPFNPVNSPIHIGIQKGRCGLSETGTLSLACYGDRPWSSPTITFNEAENITVATFAHELGHALGRNHRDTAETTYSIMSYSHSSDYVVPVDIKLLCKKHTECPPYAATWCEGGFMDYNRCPSSSYEEGEKIYKASLPDQ